MKTAIVWSYTGERLAKLWECLVHSPNIVAIPVRPSLSFIYILQAHHVFFFNQLRVGDKQFYHCRQIFPDFFVAKYSPTSPIDRRLVNILYVICWLWEHTAGAHAGKVWRNAATETFNSVHQRNLLFIVFVNVLPASTRRSPNAGLFFVQRRRRWANIKPVLGQRLGYRHWPDTNPIIACKH